MHKGRYAPRFLEQHWSPGCVPPFFAPIAITGNFAIVLDGFELLCTYYSDDGYIESERHFAWVLNCQSNELIEFQAYLAQVAGNPGSNVYFFFWLNYNGVIATSTWDFWDRLTWQWPYAVLTDSIKHRSITEGHEIQWEEFSNDVVPYF
jgi:hypothetical protein